MGYLDNSTITVDAILTKRGRELLAMGGTGTGTNPFNITQFALADDEVDYDLWNPAHPLGSAYYGTVIENMPVTEAVPDETQVMKYKLCTFPRGAYALPYLIAENIGNNSNQILIKVDASTGTLSPTQRPEERTLKVATYFRGRARFEASFNETAGYHVHLLDSTYIGMEPEPLSGTSIMGQASPIQGPSINTSVALNLLPGPLNPRTSPPTLNIHFFAKDRGLELGVGRKSTKVIITGNETGGRIVVPIVLESII